MPHIYETRVTNEENLQSVLNAIENFNFERLLCALQNRRSMSVSDILELDARITATTAKLMQEFANLQQAAPDFNKRFVHKNNHYFSTTESLLLKIRSGMAQLKDVFKQLTPNNAASVPQLPEGRTKPLIYDKSVLGNAEYTPSLFPETVRPEVNQLYEHLAAFLLIMDDAIRLCQEVITDEDAIRKDASQCVDLYMIFKDEHYFHIKHLIKQIAASFNDIEQMTNPAITLRESTASVEEFSQQGFHQLEYEDVCNLATKEIMEEANSGEVTNEELLLFPYQKHKVLNVRYIIQNFDTYLDEPYKTHKKLPAKYIAILLRWAEPKEDRAFVRYFKRTYQEANGLHLVPDNSSVNLHKNAIKGSDEDIIRLERAWNAVKI